MKAIVTEVFIDKYDGHDYKVGEVVDFDDARIDDLVSRGLVKREAVAGAKATKKAVKKGVK